MQPVTCLITGDDSKPDIEMIEVKNESDVMVDADMSDSGNNGEGDKKSVQFSDEFADDRSEMNSKESIRTIAGSKAPSHAYSMFGASNSSIITQGHAPPVPIGTPRLFSLPIDALDLATSLVKPARLSIGPAALQPPNTPAGSNYGPSMAGSTKFNSQIPSPGASVVSDDDVVVTSSASNLASFAQSNKFSNGLKSQGLLQGGFRLERSKLAKVPKLPSIGKTPSVYGDPSRSILRPQRSSHTELFTDETLEIGIPLPRREGSYYRSLPPAHLGLEQSVWVENVQEDLMRTLFRLWQMACDKHIIDNRMSVQEYYDEALLTGMEKLATLPFVPEQSSVEYSPQAWLEAERQRLMFENAKNLKELEELKRERAIQKA